VAPVRFHGPAEIGVSPGRSLCGPTSASGGISDERDGQPDPLPHPPGVRRGPSGRDAIGEPDIDEPYQQLRARQRLPAEGGEVLEVLHAGEVPIQWYLLRQIADTPLRLDGLSDDVEALDARATGGRPQQPKEQGERRGLPRSVRAQEAIDLAEPSTSSTSARATT
jgi:hypothetical protein